MSVTNSIEEVNNAAEYLEYIGFEVEYIDDTKVEILSGETEKDAPFRSALYSNSSMN